MADIFLSYASADRERIRSLVGTLEQQGWTVWWDRKIPPGRTYDQVIEEALDAARCVVVVWSQQSVQSDWVKIEADEGMNRKILVPAMIDDAKIPLAFRRIQAARLIGWPPEAPGHELESLFEAIRAILGDRTTVKKAVRQELKLVAPPPTPPSQPKLTPSLQGFRFDTVQLDASGQIIERRQGQAQQFVENLGAGITLEMVEIHGGEFWMGSPDGEEKVFESDQPRHLVKVPSFFMGKYPITQKQWRAVAGWTKVNLDLNSAPSLFKGSDLPVEQVLWQEAVEFCVRLTDRTARAYRLPSEAEWEYACRAGTTTPFAFGSTITSEIVNYDGTLPYGNAPKGVDLHRTSKVGSFGLANAFGLYDMHGNVSEWCQDVWHNNYQDAPADGGPWLSGGKQSSRVIRGGSWLNSGGHCRSGLHSGYPSADRSQFIGFRVVMDARSS